MDAAELYETDFLAWTQQQAAALRGLHGASNSLDIANLAEEIESLGNRDVREVESLIRQILIHALKLALSPYSEAVGHWRAELLTFQHDARRAFSPSMRQRIDLTEVWTESIMIFLVQTSLGDGRQKQFVSAAAQQGCPVALGAVLAEDFDLDDLLESVARSPAVLAIRAAAIPSER